MSKEFTLFEKEEFSFSSRFYRLMDLLVSNKSIGKMECFFLFTISYLQTISGFFSETLGILHEDDLSDLYLTRFNKIMRIKGLLNENYYTYQIIVYLISFTLFIFTLFFICSLRNITKFSLYSYKQSLLNSFIKIFIFCLFKPILDLNLSILCFENKNPNFTFQDISCNFNDNLITNVLCLINLIYSIFLVFFLNIYYIDTFFISHSYYGLLSCGYEIFMNINNIIYSLLLLEVNYLKVELFLSYNLFTSFIFLKFYYTNYPYYNEFTNSIAGMFHFLYVYTSIIFFAFYYIPIQEQAVLYSIGFILIIFLYTNLKVRYENNILFKTPFHKIINKHHLIFYIKKIMNKINNIDSNLEEKAELIGIINMHVIECPNIDCLSKNKDPIYLPSLEEWSDRTKKQFNDKVFLSNFIVLIYNYFIQQSYYSPDLLINLTIYYLQIIGNQCKAIFYFRKIKELKLNLQESFSFTRLNFLIKNALVEKLKSSNEICNSYDDLNTTYYFKYEDLKNKFVKEMCNDINLNLEFWKHFKFTETGRVIDTNKIFNLTNKIRNSKAKIEGTWQQMYSIHSGTNEMFELYEAYVEYINDDDGVMRILEGIKNKNNTISFELINSNYYNLLFSKEIGIIIANGDRSKEGLIEKTNQEIENIFGFKSEECKCVNVTNIMPKIFQKDHNSFIQKFFNIGEKRIIDKQYKSFGKDKENSIVPLVMYLKLFPMLTDSIYFCNLILKENMDDVIFLDSDFIIQGMSKKLMERFNLNSNTFQQADVPFYLICKTFIDIYAGRINMIENEKENMILKRMSSKYITKKEYRYEESNKSLIKKLKNESNHSTTTLRTLPDKGNEFILEILETEEIEFEIKIPKFLNDYISSINKKDMTKFEFYKKKLSMMNPSRIISNDFTTVPIDIRNSNSKTQQKEYSTEDNENEDEKLIGNSKSNLEESIYPEIKTIDEESEFLIKIGQLKSLFESKKFNDLKKEVIDLDDNNNNESHAKFIVTFNKQLYAGNRLSYVIRCIDLKSDGEESSPINSKKISDGYNKNPNKLGLEEKYILTDKDISRYKKRENDVNKLLKDDGNFSKNFNHQKEEIRKFSILFGITKEEVGKGYHEEESASQLAGIIYNENYSQKAKIDEIRSNAMKKVSEFYTLKWIKSIVFLWLLLTIIFGFVYIIFFDQIYQNLTKISDLNTNLLQTTIWMTNLISSLISMRSLYFNDINQMNVNYNTFIPNKQEYFKYLKNSSLIWYYNITESFASLEMNINSFLTDNKIFWEIRSFDIYKKLGFFEKNETFPFGIAEILQSSKDLLSNEYFDINNPRFLNNTLSNDMIYSINYSSIIAIENSINNYIPKQISLVSDFPQIFINYNYNNTNLLIIFLSLYSFLMIFLGTFYIILLYLTNKNIYDGLVTVSKIKHEKIEETIKKIEIFYERTLSRFVMKEGKHALSEEREKFEKEDSSKLRNYIEKTKLIRLTLISYSYFQVVVKVIIMVSLLIPIYFTSLNMIQNTNTIISIDNYIFGKSLLSSIKTVNIKCEFDNCGITPLYYNNINERSQVENLIRQIPGFSDISNFYNLQYLLNACKVLYSDSSSKQYNDCMNDKYVIAANNTESLLHMIDDTVFKLEKEMMLLQQLNTINKTSTPFNNKMMFESNLYRQMEYIFYKYLVSVPDNFARIISISLTNYIENNRSLIIILISIYALSFFMFSLYVVLVYLNELINYLSISRCILRIIPTNILASSVDLKNWIKIKS